MQPINRNRIISLALFISISILPEALIAQYRQLNVSDYKTIPATSSSHLAYTNWRISYKSQIVSEKERVKLDVKVTVIFDSSISFLKEDVLKMPKAWIEKVLRHEQGYFDLGYLFSLELEKNMNNLSLSQDNFVGVLEIDSLYSVLMDKYIVLRTNYNRDTGKGVNSEAQSRWEAWLEEQITSEGGTIASKNGQ